MYSLVIGIILTISSVAIGQNFPAQTPVISNTIESDGGLDDLNPFDPQIEQTLDLYDAEYQSETGFSPFLPLDLDWLSASKSTCYRASCTIWARTVKAEQKMYLYINGDLSDIWSTSTGLRGHGTPDFDKHPNGRIYERYTSRRYPGGDYNGLGNMPYAVFIEGGFAIHGTAKSNWPKLGSPASHGCVRIHPDNAYRFNRLVREHGIKQTWITIE